MLLTHGVGVGVKVEVGGTRVGAVVGRGVEVEVGDAVGVEVGVGVSVGVEVAVGDAVATGVKLAAGVEDGGMVARATAVGSTMTGRWTMPMVQAVNTGHTSRQNSMWRIGYSFYRAIKK